MHSPGADYSETDDGEKRMQVEELLRKAEDLLNEKEYEEALSYYNDVLHIDENNIDGLAGRAAVYIETGKHTPAQQDARNVLYHDPDNIQGHYLLAVSCHNLGQHHKSLVSFLQALDLDTDLSHVEMLTNNIASVAVELCGCSEKLTDSLADMDPYKKLCEVGTRLCKCKMYELCIKVLDAAQQLETNQIGITMKVQLTLGNAHSALKHKDLAVTLYQELLSTAVSAHDTYYQMKALVNVASLFLEILDTHQAIVYYNKLIDLQHELQGGDKNAALPDFWTPQLTCALHVNLSIAYKVIGDMAKATTHASEYSRLVQSGTRFSTHDKAESCHNLGVLHEILGHYDDARCQYEAYQKLSKEDGDVKAIAHAYGCLGSVYSQLRNAELTFTYHRQQITLLGKIKATSELLAGFEQMGNSLAVLGKYEQAVEVFQDMLRACPRGDVRSRAMALCKTGSAHRMLQQRDRAMHCYEQALPLAEIHDLTDLIIMCQYNQAVLVQHSTIYTELDRGYQYLERLIPLFEAKMQRATDEDTFCPDELRLQLDECYTAMQNILALLGKNEECLLYSERAKKRPLVAMMGENVCAGVDSCHTGLFNTWSMERTMRVVSQQNATVVCYSVLQSDLLIWVLQPAKGLVAFCKKTSVGSKQSMGELLRDIISQVKRERDVRQMLSRCESRALPLADLKLRRKRERNARLSSAKTQQEEQSHPERKDTSSLSVTADEETKQRSPEKQLFDMLLAPVYGMFTTLPPESPVVFIPDRELFQCSFGVIRDWNGASLHELFRISCVSSLYLLERVVNNELDQVRRRSEVEVRRQRVRMAGMSNLLSSNTKPCKQSAPTAMLSDFNTKCTSNPILVRSLTCDALPDETIASTDESYSWQTSSTHDPGCDEDVANRQVLIEKAMGAHTLTTLVTRTSTNTDVVMSSVIVPEFKQVSLPDKCTVIGNPFLPESLLVQGEPWHPSGEMKTAHKECFNVATYLDVTAIVGHDATKDRFMQELTTSTVIHIATMGCREEGLLMMSPNIDEVDERGSLQEHAYVVTAKEISAVTMTAKLVILSSCWSSLDTHYVDIGFTLPSAFLTAGVQCVLTLLWAIPDDALGIFYHDFYKSLQKGNRVSSAVSNGMKALRANKRYDNVSYSAPFILIGKDVMVDLTDIRHSMVDQMLDEQVGNVILTRSTNPLNLEPVVPAVADKEDRLRIVQECMSSLLATPSEQGMSLVSSLIDLLDGSLKRLHTTENNLKPVNLPSDVITSPRSMELLRLLGFHFQGKGSVVDNPYVLYPHWNRGQVLVPIYDALGAVAVIMSSQPCARALSDFIPASQEVISNLVDVLCVTKHAPEIQLKVCDRSVKPLWKTTKVKRLMMAVGFRQIGPLLNFRSVTATRKLLTATLQFLVSISVHKSTVLLYKLDIDLLGGPHSNKTSTVSLDNVFLPSLTPMLLPRNQLRMMTPWLSRIETSGEMEEKIKLAKSKSDLNTEYSKHKKQTRSWHRMTLAAQASEALEEYGRPQVRPAKIKIGSSPETPPKTTLAEIAKHREHAHSLLKQRLVDVALQHRSDINKLYLPYLQNV